MQQIRGVVHPAHRAHRRWMNDKQERGKRGGLPRKPEDPSNKKDKQSVGRMQQQTERVVARCPIAEQALQSQKVNGRQRTVVQRRAHHELLPCQCEWRLRLHDAQPNDVIAAQKEPTGRTVDESADQQQAKPSGHDSDLAIDVHLHESFEVFR